MTTVTIALVTKSFLLAFLLLLLISVLWLVDDRYTPPVPDRWPTAHVTRETRSADGIGNFPILPESSEKSSLSTSCVFKSFQYLLGLSDHVTASTTSTIEKYHSLL